MVDSKGALRWKGFPPVAYVQMEVGGGGGGWVVWVGG